MRKLRRILIALCLVAVLALAIGHGRLPNVHCGAHRDKAHPIGYSAQATKDTVLIGATPYAALETVKLTPVTAAAPECHAGTPFEERILHKIEQSGPVVPRESVTRIIVFTQVRSGSTLTAAMLRLTPRSFIVNEPFLEKAEAVRFNDSYFDSQKYLLRELFDCSFSSYGDRYELLRLWLHRSNRFHGYCPHPHSLKCARPAFLCRACKRAAVIIVKIVRIHFSQLRTWMRENTDLGPFIVLHLVRDPRAIMASRLSLTRHFCKNTSCEDHAALCRDMKADLHHFNELKRLSPNTTFQIRFEDLLANLSDTMRTIYAKLNLQYTWMVEGFLRTHTFAIVKEPDHSLVRNSTTVAFSWRSVLPFTKILTFQKACHEVLRVLGYLHLNTTKDLAGPPPILPRPLLS